LPPSEAEPRTHAAEASSRRAAGDIVFQIAGQGVNLALGIVVTAILARGLGTTDYGQWATLLATVELVATVGNLGLEQVAIRHAAQEHEREGLWVGAATGLQLVLALPVMIVFLVVVAFVANDTPMLVAGALFSLLFITGAISTLRIVFRLQIRNHLYIGFLTANSIIWAAAVVAITAAGGGLVAYAIAFVATAILIQGTMALVALRTMDVHWRGARRLWPVLARVGISVGVAGAVTYAYGRIDQILLYQLAPHANEVGLYAAAYKILESASSVPQAVMTTLFPILSALYPGNPGRLRRILQAAFDYLILIAFGGLALTLVASDPIIHLIYGAEYAQAASVLPILFASFVPVCIGNVAGNMVIATDQQRTYIWFAAIGLLVNLGLNFALIPHLGMEGAAWATLATEVVVVGVTTRMVLRRMRVAISLRRIIAGAVAAAATGLAVLALREAGLGAIPLVIAMAAIYPLALVGLRAVDLDELRELMRSRRDAERLV
jgi:O-antigen/teichoic acid export membrane protein